MGCDGKQVRRRLCNQGFRDTHYQLVNACIPFCSTIVSTTGWLAVVRSKAYGGLRGGGGHPHDENALIGGIAELVGSLFQPLQRQRPVCCNSTILSKRMHRNQKRPRLMLCDGAGSRGKTAVQTWNIVDGLRCRAYRYPSISADEEARRRLS